MLSPYHSVKHFFVFIEIIQSLHDEAAEAGITCVNECGVDPGNGMLQKKMYLWHYHLKAYQPCDLTTTVLGYRYRR